MTSIDPISGGGSLVDAFMPRTNAVRSLSELKDAAEDPQRVREAAEGFEEVLLQKLLDEMQKTVLGGGLLDSGATKQVQGLFNMMMAKHVAKSGGIGLADQMYSEFCRMANVSPDGADGMELER